MQINKLFMLFTLLLSLSVAKAQLTEGKEYTVLSSPIQSTHADKIELTEFFAYFCIHCQHYSPLIEKYAQSLPDDVVLRTEHVAWDPSLFNLLRITVAVNQSQMPEANQYIFAAVLDERINLGNEAIFVQWAQNQKNFDSKKLLAAYKQKNNIPLSEEMAKLTNKHQIDATPTFIVDGKYKVDLKALRNDADLIRILNELIELARNNKKPIAVFNNIGSTIAWESNQ